MHIDRSSSRRVLAPSTHEIDAIGNDDLFSQVGYNDDLFSQVGNMTIYSVMAPAGATKMSDAHPRHVSGDVMISSCYSPYCKDNTGTLTIPVEVPP